MSIITSQLEIEDITDVPQELHRLIMFDPAGVYQRLYMMNGFSHYKRFNSLNMDVLFPTLEKGICACGCNRKLQGKARRWYSKDCSKFALDVFWIIQGKSDFIRSVMYDIYGGYYCVNCGINDWDAHKLYYKPTKSGICNSQIQLDHIIPVHQGGGGCWLGNYQFLCTGCHKEKTRKDKII